ncbi:mandelate racemase/muconate lactonizing enzyme family protein [Acidovorax sp. CCYZU-2555]|uniref:L-talarate/galactarate dehydratase n=1 Tax=Acidovorax sp. CCYZU-2555 TaxID=2835042 RepID=UPI001BD002BA|nr:mandelate racemase/muconate lactonizing enzyme family protein [Acidovorax sp. CCYZU-2555]MBS7780482.1 mandelate racemase/muconate lactonizing enzyme family protein [Acidovorax sp. CCYZU-2555]
MTTANSSPANAPLSADSIAWVRVSSCYLPLAHPISDAKVLTGRQKPMTEIAMLFVEIQTKDGHHGLGFSYSKRAGGPGQFAHAKEIAPALLGEDPNDISKLWTKLQWAGASVGRSGMAVQAIGAFDVALYDLKARRAGLSLSKLLGSQRDCVRCYNTSGGFLHTPLDQLLVNAAASRERGIGGIKLKVGQPNQALDVQRVEAVRKHLGDDMPLMVDANQQWDRPSAQRMCRIFEQFNLVWIEEPLDAYDFEGHAALAAQFDTPIATGEMLTSAAEHAELIRHRAADYLMPDAPRVGGITPFLRIAAQAENAGLALGPHFAMELHVHLGAVYATEPWVEHFDWLEPLFNERLEIKDGRMLVPTRPGLGLSLSEQAQAWTREVAEVGKRP